MRFLLALLLGAMLAGGCLAQSFEPAEVQRILQHGHWPPPWTPDPSNRASGNPAAVELGRRLFFDARLSGPGTLSCASCHLPEQAWTDGRPRSQGQELVDRNAPSLLDVRYRRWFGWDGAADSLWAQSIRPLLDAREMAGGAGHVAAVVRGDADLACRYRSVFGAVPDDDDAALVGAAKALAAFQETLVSGRTAFDEFRDALQRGGDTAYPEAARRGLRLFVGDAGCLLCHVGAGFTNNEFHDIGVPFFVAQGRVDPGRHGGIQRLQQSSFNLLGRHNDDPGQATATRTRHVALQHRNWGEFRVPSLRNVARTAPYMHNGSAKSLRDVLRHYSEVDEDRLHADGERLIRPLRLTDRQIDDLVAFLETLTSESVVPQGDPTPCTP
jgi:cytochrome c peroxidase